MDVRAGVNDGAPAATFGVLDCAVHPDYAGRCGVVVSGGANAASDIAILVLTQPVPASWTTEPPPRYRADPHPVLTAGGAFPTAGETVTSVGYGLTSIIPATGAGFRRWLNGTIDTVPEAVGELTMSFPPGSGIAEGDSGGPVLWTGAVGEPRLAPVVGVDNRRIGTGPGRLAAYIGAEPLRDFIAANLDLDGDGRTDIHCRTGARAADGSLIYAIVGGVAPTSSPRTTAMETVGSTRTTTTRTSGTRVRKTSTETPMGS